MRLRLLVEVVVVAQSPLAMSRKSDRLEGNQVVTPKVVVVLAGPLME
tara:strand:- start:226 stop:366 length:141 start_codon:yes stop_codon:yes gene_type:complete